MLAKAAIVTGGGLVLLLYPELALAVFLVVGDLKGDDRIAAVVPFDLTLAVGAILVAGILLNLIRERPIVPMPPVYFLFLVLVVMMTASLTYAPNFAAGLEKLGLFLTLTAIAIVAPFFVLPDARRMTRFLWSFGGASFAICFASLSGLGGAARLVTPSDNTIGLGRLGCALGAMIWFAGIAQSPLRKRLLAYTALAVPLIAMVGSGSRGSVVSLALVVLGTLFFCRRLFLDAAALALPLIAALSFIKIPASSFEYLHTLTSAQSVSALLDFRGDLLEHGWNLVRQHPLIGVGIGGFRYTSPNPSLYKWPHNICLELACELGIPAALIGFAIFGSAIREAYRQLHDAASPYFRLSMIAAALLCIGAVTSITTGDINSDRSIWLFVSLVFVIRGFRRGGGEPLAADADIARSPVFNPGHEGAREQ